MKDSVRVKEFVPSWVERGRAEGREEGRLKGQLDLLLRQVTGRFHINPPAEDRDALSKLSCEGLETLGVSLVNAPTYDKWRADLHRLLREAR